MRQLKDQVKNKNGLVSHDGKSWRLQNSCMVVMAISENAVHGNTMQRKENIVG